MPTLEITRDISAPADRTWQAISDIGGVHRFHPAVERSPLHGDKARGVGARRVCHFYDGNHITEKVVGWDEGRSLDVDIVEGSMPVDNASASLRVEPLGSGSRVSMTLRYEPRYGVFGKLMDAVMMRGMFRKLLRSVLQGLDTHLETGAEIGKGGKPVPAPQAAAA